MLIAPRPRYLFAAVVVAATIALIVPGSARAHAFLVRTTPQAGERLTASPSELVVQFSESVVASSEEITLRTAEGRPVPTGPVERARGGTVLRTALGPLDEAIYVVNWRVLAADGHLAAGELAFAVGTGGRLPVASRTVSGAIAWRDAGASWLFHTGLVLAIGGLVSEAFVWRPVARRRGFVAPGAPVGPALAVSLLGAGLQLALLFATRGGIGDVTDVRPWAGVLATKPGLLTAAELAFVAYGLWILRMPRLRAWSLVPLMGAVGAAAWRGHSGSSPDWWAAPANALHLTLAGFWVGALLHLVLVLAQARDAKRKQLLVEAADRYARLALILVPPLLVAGVVTALAQFSEPSQLIGTVYGWVLLTKLVFVVVALGLALAARLRALTRQPERLDLFGRLIGVESAALATVLAVTAVLVSTAPPRTVAAEAELLGPPPLEGPALRLASYSGQVAVHLAAADGELQVRAVAPGSRPAGNALLQIQGRGPTGASLTLHPRSCGPGCFTMGFPWPEGTTTLTMTLADERWTGGTTEFRVPWPPAPEEPELLDQVVRTMGEQPTIRLTERVSSGPGATTGPNAASLTGQQFLAQAVYAAGGASDVRQIPSDQDVRILTLYIPGSTIWARLEMDAANRLRSETIIGPGHLIERTFAYE